jgi:UDP-2,3-diacylglucosamine pyrophosphatase LpxH
MKLEFKEIFISDLHLLSSKPNLPALECLFEKCEIEKIHCIGDFIDCWRLFSNEMKELKGQDADRQLRIFRKILKRLETYVFGNHDDILFKLAHFGEYPVGSIKICHDRLINIENYPCMLIHGHQWDFIVSRSKWLSKKGDSIYHLALKMNDWYNWLRRHKRKKNSRISNLVKRLGKIYLTPFVDNATKHAHENNCQIIICGHIHTPGYYYDYIRNVLYINTGCFTNDACTFIGMPKTGGLFIYKIKDSKIEEITPNLLDIFK